MLGRKVGREYATNEKLCECRRKKRRRKLKKYGPAFLGICELCNVTTHSPTDWPSHCASNRHREKKIEADERGNEADIRKRKEEYARYWAANMRFLRGETTVAPIDPTLPPRR